MANRYPYTLGQFSGVKFAARYNLDAVAGDFWADDQFIYLREGVTLLDDPPILDRPDPPREKFDPSSANLGFTGTMKELLED